jgi:hypothetical protein
LGEGLAIGSSAAQGKITLATLLVIGFALHNATEGFGIVAPLTADIVQPGWGFLLLLGLIGGGPYFAGNTDRQPLRRRHKRPPHQEPPQLRRMTHSSTESAGRRQRSR